MSRGRVYWIFFQSELEDNVPWHPFCSQHYSDILQHTIYTNALLSSPLAPSLLCQEGRGKAVRLSRHQWPSRRFSTCVMCNVCMTLYLLLMYDSLSLVLGNTEQPPRHIRGGEARRHSRELHLSGHLPLRIEICTLRKTEK